MTEYYGNIPENEIDENELYKGMGDKTVSELKRLRNRAIIERAVQEALKDVIKPKRDRSS